MVIVPKCEHRQELRFLFNMICFLLVVIMHKPCIRGTTPKIKGGWTIKDSPMLSKALPRHI